MNLNERGKTHLFLQRHEQRGPLDEESEEEMDARRGKRIFGQPVGTSGTSKNKVLQVDANSERNDVFYKQPGFQCEYPKMEVYPREGGEFQLEMFRARLSRYCPPPRELQSNSMEVSMEMTMACATNITILPGFNNRQILDKENVSAQPRLQKVFGQRVPLQRLPLHSDLSPDERLAQLNEEMGGTSVTSGRRGMKEGKKDKDSGEISELLDNMMLQQSAERQLEKQNREEKVAGVGTRDQLIVAGKSCYPPDMEKLINQENSNPPPSLKSNNSIGGCATRLNFSDAESSLCNSQLNSLVDDSVGGRTSLLGNSQVRVHEQSDAGGQSFDVFHDSWKSQSHNGSYGRADKLQSTKRQSKPEKKTGVTNPHSLAESYQSYDQSYSFQAKSNMSSFSVYEDPTNDQSSLVPYHDSWAGDSTKENQPGGGGGGGGGGGAESAVEKEMPLKSDIVEERREDVGVVVYHKTLGVRLDDGKPGWGGDGEGKSTFAEQSFTQFGISHPNVAPSISTPVGKKVDITFDISRIHTETEVFSQPQPNQPSQNGMVVAVSQRQKKSCSMAPINLSTIKEESSSSRSSTTSSSSSSTSSGCVSQESLSSAEVHVNPFSSEIVNMMLNSMSPSLVDKVMHHHLGQAPQLVSGRRVLLGHQEYTGLKKIASGGFGNIYTCSEKGDSKVLKVQKPAMQWEMAVIAELHARLSESSLNCQWFVKAEKTHIFNDASIMVLPHYRHGSLLDLANAHGAHIQESFLFYYSAEVLDIVDTLHGCGILHTDLKPDNFMLTDLSSHRSFGSAVGKGLVLIDFGRAVDLAAFPGDAMFHGSCNTEGFQCRQMIEGNPWKFEADYFGVAGTVYVLLTGKYMSLEKNHKNDLYQPSNFHQRRQSGTLWPNLLGCLLNSTLTLPLSEMAADMRKQVNGIKPYVFMSFYKKMATTVQKMLCR